jgi:wyosine [tRNA(Phe)-imidazoG37] synthetase (radical SAM superfamily)
MTATQHLFGPVPSRRLGRSLGIDLVPFKTCTYDCVYCECGRTTRHTTHRREFFPVRQILREMDAFLTGEQDLDFITFSGSGEPTLSLSLGTVIRHLKKAHPEHRVAVLTNGSLLWMDGVRRDLAGADVVLPTLTSTDPETWRRIHRPCPDLDLGKILQGMVSFRDAFHGEIWVEVFVIPDLNTGADQVTGIRNVLQQMRPDRIQLNTLDRPGADVWVKPAGPDELKICAEALGERVEIISDQPEGREKSRGHGIAGEICSLLARRPCTVEDLAGLMRMHPAEVRKHLAVLQREGRVQAKRGGRGLFFTCRE